MKFFLGVAAILLLGTGTAQAAKMSVDEIVDKANHVSYFQGEDGRASVRMVITDAQGRKRSREFTILRKDVDPDGADEGEQKFYVYFSRPADVDKTAFLVWKHVGADDDRWLYLPALDLVKRIAASDERTSFVGSHYFYEDVSGRNPEEDHHELLEETDDYYILKSVPVDPGSVEFSWYKNYIHKATFIPVKTEFFDAKGRKYRENSVEKVETIDGFPTVMQSRMKDLRSGGETVQTFLDVTYNVGLPDVFTERYLRNPPRRYLK